MYRAIAGLCLIAALTGPLLRQAEAADDLARSLLALFQPSGIASSDLGVGDEPDLIPCKTTDLAPAFALHPTARRGLMACDLSLFPPFTTGPPSASILPAEQRAVALAAIDPPSAPMRLAWLQTLRF